MYLCTFLFGLKSDYLIHKNKLHNLNFSKNSLITIWIISASIMPVFFFYISMVVLLFFYQFCICSLYIHLHIHLDKHHFRNHIVLFHSKSHILYCCSTHIHLHMLLKQYNQAFIKTISNHKWFNRYKIGSYFWDLRSFEVKFR